jgi:hypothetical protein
MVKNLLSSQLRQGIFCYFLIALSFLSTHAYAARPFVTDDARLTTAGSCQVETWTRSYPSSLETWALPACNPTGNLEFTVGGGRAYFDALATPNSTDYVYQAKTLFRKLDLHTSGIGLAVGMVHHPSIQVGPNQHGNQYAFIPISVPLNEDRLIMHLNPGILRDKASQETRKTWGIGFEFNATPRWMLIAESFGDTSTGSYWQSGVRFAIIPNLLQVDTTTGKKYSGSSETQWISFGLRFTPSSIF